MRVVPTLLLAAATAATVVPSGTGVASPEFALSVVVEASGPTALAFRAGDPALYVAEWRGTVQRVHDGVAALAVDITDLVGPGDQDGLLGLAFSPDGSLAYVDYVDADGAIAVAELSVAADGGFERDSLRPVIAIDQPYEQRSSQLVTGLDGLLYISVGDGGGDGDPDRAGQSLITPLGKLLRIDPTPSAGLGYTNPADNPYIALAGLLDEIWSLGLHDPAGFSFDPDTGDLWVTDRGVDSFEEISVDPAVDGADAGRNANFGWSAYEGEQRFNNDMTAEQHRRPIFTYPHADGRCAVTAGVRARGAGSGALAGSYVFADACSGELLALPVTGTGESLAVGDLYRLLTTSDPRAVVAGADGTIYVLTADAVNRLHVPTG
jgi:glucose/arabinose dehydrogenase